MAKKIGIYVDKGSSLDTIIRAVAQDVDSSYIVQAIVAEHLDNDNFLDEFSVFIMPGGEDLPYCAKLNGSRNARLRSWVERGGIYLGICAGAYYGCSEIVFNGYYGEIAGTRELAFLKGIAIGSIPELAPLYDNTLKSAAVVSLVMETGEITSSFYHGGPFFQIEEDGARVLARYETVKGKPAAIVESSVGDGKALLCGVHPEVSERTSARILTSLKMVENKRRKLWRMLLKSCGLKLK